ncbi:MAG: DUF11 domain-containing protein [Trueperaceae bacterium]|nr:DUF11 domain-containing protein [Trueperaceae bacterium]
MRIFLPLSIFFWLVLSGHWFGLAQDPDPPEIDQNAISTELETFILDSNGTMRLSSSALTGQTVVYRLTASNISGEPLPEYSVTITLAIPEGTTYIPDSATENSKIGLEVSEDTLSWTVLSVMEPDEKIVFEYRVWVGDPLAIYKKIFTGSGSGTTAVINPGHPWLFDYFGSKDRSIYLYNDESPGERKELIPGRLVKDTGYLYILVNTANEDAWTLTVYFSQNEGTLATPGINQFDRSKPSLLQHEKACADFENTLEAQSFFIREGGPELDPYALDTDGDGFACSYDPQDTYESTHGTSSADSCEAQEHWVPPYIRKDGQIMGGHCRTT